MRSWQFLIFSLIVITNLKKTAIPPNTQTDSQLEVYTPDGLQGPPSFKIRSPIRF